MAASEWISKEKLQQALERWRSGSRMTETVEPFSFSPGMAWSPSEKIIMDDLRLAELLELDPLGDQIMSDCGDFFVPFSNSSSPAMSLSPDSISPLVPIHFSGPRSSESSEDRLSQPVHHLTPFVSTSASPTNNSRSPTAGRVSIALKVAAAGGMNDCASPCFSPTGLSSLNNASSVGLSFPGGMGDSSCHKETHHNCVIHPCMGDLSYFINDVWYDTPNDNIINEVAQLSENVNIDGDKRGNHKSLLGSRKLGESLVFDESLEILGVAAGTEVPSVEMQTLHNSTTSNEENVGQEGGGSQAKEQTVRERVIQALRGISSSIGGGTLIQIWVPTVHGNELVLSTRDQPFVCTPNDDRLYLYRNVSSNVVFPTRKGSSEYPDLLGRVYRTKAPEWSPNVLYYGSHEFLRASYAEQCCIRGTLAVPVFEDTSRNCLAVIELITKSEKVEFGPEIDIICRALKAVNLSTALCSVPPPEIKTGGRHIAVVEILEVLTAVCETHKLPLAQTWVPAWTDGSHGGLHTSDGGPVMTDFPGLAAAASGEPRLVLHTANGPCYVADPDMWGFRRACSEQVLERNQGVPGMTFSSNQPVFESDVKNYQKHQYPLGHYARMFRLSAAVAIRLRSIHTGRDDYVLEFFLPPTCVIGSEQQSLLHSLSITMQRVCRSLRTVTAKEMEEENNDQGSEGTTEVKPVEGLFSKGAPQSSDLNLAQDVKAKQHQQVEDSHQQSNHSQNQHFSPKNTHEDSEARDPWRSHPDQHDGPKSKPTSPYVVIGLEGSNKKRRLERRRGTNEKPIDLNVLQQNFAGSLKDAAKSVADMSGTSLSHDKDSEYEALQRQLEEVKQTTRAAIEELERSHARKLNEIEELEKVKEQVRKESKDLLNEINEHLEIERSDQGIESSQSKIQALQPQHTLKLNAETKSEDRTIVDAFAPLSDEAELAVDKALGGGERQEILVMHEKSNIGVTRALMQCLSPGKWLNDEVINVYMELLKEREIREPHRFLKCHFFNTFFYNKLQDGDYDAITSWTTQEKLGYSLLDCDKIVVPIHRINHWCLAVIDVHNKRFEYLDSLKGEDQLVFNLLDEYIFAEAKDKNDKILDVLTWDRNFPKDIPEQLNSYDCGIFMVKYADFHSRGASLHFTKDHIEYFRRKMVWEILNLKAT